MVKLQAKLNIHVLWYLTLLLWQTVAATNRLKWQIYLPHGGRHCMF